jgi:iron-sulfur cluster assembly protein
MSKTLCDSSIQSSMPSPPQTKVDRRKSPITVTDTAVQRIKDLISQRDSKYTLGIRIGVKSSGCTGLAYTFEYVDEEKHDDEKIQLQNADVYIYIDSKALLFLFGTKLDFVETELESGFVFINPNSKGECGCGESFYV